LSEDEATHIARELSPDSPWMVDRPAYLIGKRFCAPRDPKCEQCPARIRCLYVTRGYYKVEGDS
jgi:endonuclease III